MLMMTAISLNTAWAADEQVREPNISAGSYVVMSGSTSEVVHAVHAERKLPIGSITKLMTAMVVLDNMYDDSELSNMVQISGHADSYGDMFSEGEEVSVENLLYAMLTGGSDEAAEALASYSATDRDIFVSEMNSKAMELGLLNTQFHNPTGRYHTDHYSTALDTAVIVQYAMRYTQIRDALSADAYAIKVSGKEKGRKFTVTNTDPLLASTDTDERFKYETGGILGSLADPQAFSQYAGVSAKSGMQLIVILLEANGDDIAKDARKLMSYGYKKVSMNTIVKADKKVGTVRIKNGALTKLPVYTATKGYAYVPPEGSTSLVQTQVVIDNDVKAPLKAGDKVGEYRIYVADELKGTVDLVIKKDVEKGWFPSKIYISNRVAVLIGVILLAIIVLAIRIWAVKRRRAARRERLCQEEIRRRALEQQALEDDRRRRNWTYK